MGPETRRLIAATAANTLVSVTSIWEIAIKRSLGKLEIDVPTAAFVRLALEEDGFAVIDIATPHALAVESLPMIHRDPFDRMLIAQARHAEVPLVTSDPRFTDYDIEVIDAGA